jgi:hypothetical protein
MKIFKRPWQKIAAAAAGSSAVSTLSVLIGVPLDKRELSAIFMKNVCLTIAGGYVEKCLTWVVAVSLIGFAASIFLLLKNIKKVKRFWKIPGWVVGILIYAASYMTTNVALLGMLG